jgi:hypothetical protein
LEIEQPGGDVDSGFEEDECSGGGDYIGVVAWPGGKGSRRIQRETLGDQQERTMFGQESLAGMTSGPRSSVTEEERRG